MADARQPVVVVGYLIRYPVAGMAWVMFNWLLALRDLGYEPVFMEAAVNDDACYDVDAAALTDDPSYGTRFLETAASSAGLDGLRWWYAGGGRSYGMSDDEAAATLESSAALINVGASSWNRMFRRAPLKILLDCDAPLTQIALASGREPLTAMAAAHDVLATTAVNLAEGRVDGIPHIDRPWVPAVPPIHLDSWPVVPLPDDGPWTTVTSWSTGAVEEWDGRTYGQKDRIYETLVDLPGRIPEVDLELAIASNAPTERLAAAGWSIVDPVTVTRDLPSLTGYIHGSRGELAVAKHAFVAGGTGQVNDRLLLYLASGRPVACTDTGLSWLPTGEGLVPFRSIEGAARAITTAEAEPDRHTKAARAIADRFDAATVVGDLLDRVGVRSRKPQ